MKLSLEKKTKKKLNQEGGGVGDRITGFRRTFRSTTKFEDKIVEYIDKNEKKIKDQNSKNVYVRIMNFRVFKAKSVKQFGRLNRIYYNKDFVFKKKHASIYRHGYKPFIENENKNGIHRIKDVIYGIKFEKTKKVMKKNYINYEKIIPIDRAIKNKSEGISDLNLDRNTYFKNQKNKSFRITNITLIHKDVIEKYFDDNIDKGFLEKKPRRRNKNTLGTGENNEIAENQTNENDGLLQNDYIKTESGTEDGDGRGGGGGEGETLESEDGEEEGTKVKTEGGEKKEPYRRQRVMNWHDRFKLKYNTKLFDLFFICMGKYLQRETDKISDDFFIINKIKQVKSGKINYQPEEETEANEQPKHSEFIKNHLNSVFYCLGYDSVMSENKLQDENTQLFMKVKFKGPKENKQHFILNETKDINLSKLDKKHIKFGIVRNENILTFNLIQTGNGKGTDTLKLVILKKIHDINYTGSGDNSLTNYYIFYNLFLRIKKEDYDIIFGPLVQNIVEEPAFEERMKKLGINVSKEDKKEFKKKEKEEKKKKKKKKGGEQDEPDEPYDNNRNDFSDIFFGGGLVVKSQKNQNLEKQQIIRYFDDKRYVAKELIKNFV
jgi:hypothetical protein